MNYNILKNEHTWMNLIVILDTLKKEPAKKNSAFIPNIKNNLSN